MVCGPALPWASQDLNVPWMVQGLDGVGRAAFPPPSWDPVKAWGPRGRGRKAAAMGR